MGNVNSGPARRRPDVQCLSDLQYTAKNVGDLVERNTKYIVVLGDEDADKSNFIYALIKDTSIVGDSQPYLNTSTQHIRVFSFKFHQWIDGLIQEICLVNVPSFTTCSLRNAEIWTQLTSLLHFWEISKRDVVGVVYVHDFTKENPTNALLDQNLEILDKLLGSDNHDRCIISPPLDAILRCNPRTKTQLLESARAKLTDPNGVGRLRKDGNSHKAIIKTFDGTTNSARTVIGFLPFQRFVPAVSTEVVGDHGPHTAIYHSAAGQLVYRHLAEIRSFVKTLHDSQKAGRLLKLLDQAPQEQPSAQVAREFARLESQHHENRLHRKRLWKATLAGATVIVGLFPLIGVPAPAICEVKFNRWANRKEREERQEVSALAYRALKSLQDSEQSVSVAAHDGKDATATTSSATYDDKTPQDGGIGQHPSSSSPLGVHGPSSRSSNVLGQEPEFSPSMSPPQLSLSQTLTTSGAEHEETLPPPSYADTMREGPN